MNFDPNTCKIIVWGMHNVYQTHSHIHEGFFRAAERMRSGSLWIDQDDQIAVDWSNTLVISEHNPAQRPELPIRDDCFYVIHGLNDDPGCRKHFQKVKNRLSWNVHHDCSHAFTPDYILIEEDTPLYPNENHMEFRWATDLLPDEIERNKPAHILGSDSNIIWYVGTQWWVNQKELAQFKKAVEKDGKEFRPIGAGQIRNELCYNNRSSSWGNTITLENNIHLMRESFFAPAISGSHHLTEGYVPCRIFKNISYGQYGVTNNLRAYQIMDMKPIFNSDPYQLYFDAKEKLVDCPQRVKELHAQMDLVAQKHTYINRIKSILKAVQIILEQK